MTDATPYVIPAEPGRWRALSLAVAMHALLLGVLWISVQWQSATPEAVEAEIWSPVVADAAPVAPPPPPEPEKQVEPEPETAPPPPKAVEAPKIDPEIALRAEKKRKEEQKRREEEEREKKKKLEQEKKDKEKAEADKKKADELKKKAQEKADAAAAEKRRKADLDRMMAQAGSGGSGTAPKSTGSTDAGYNGRIGAKIKSNTTYAVPEGLVGNPPVEYSFDLFPDGTIRRPIRKTRSSGVPGFDEAVLNAIEKSQPYPADKTGNVPKSISISHKPKD